MDAEKSEIKEIFVKKKYFHSLHLGRSLIHAGEGDGGEKQQPDQEEGVFETCNGGKGENTQRTGRKVG